MNLFVAKVNFLIFFLEINNTILDSLCCYFALFSFSYYRSRCRGHCSIPEDPHGHKPIHMRNMQQRVPERPKPSASPKGSQPSVEAKTKVQQRGEKEGLYLPWTNLRPPRPCKSTRRPHWHQKAFQQKARREEVEVWKVLQEIRSPIRLESSHQNLWN